jgi:hypothetical protein
MLDKFLGVLYCAGFLLLFGLFLYEGQAWVFVFIYIVVVFFLILIPDKYEDGTTRPGFRSYYKNILFERSELISDRKSGELFRQRNMRALRVVWSVLCAGFLLAEFITLPHMTGSMLFFYGIGRVWVYILDGLIYLLMFAGFAFFFLPAVAYGFSKFRIVFDDEELFWEGEEGTENSGDGESPDEPDEPGTSDKNVLPQIQENH